MSKNALVFWFTGLSGAGKTTISQGLAARLTAKGISVRILDGDDVRGQRDKPLTFSYEDIVANNRAMAQLAKSLRGTYQVILVPIISPIAEIRAEHRRVLSPGFYEVYIKATLPCVIERDVKGLYKKVASGQIKDMIGCEGGVAYEEPKMPDMTIDTQQAGVADCTAKLEQFVLQRLNSAQEEGS